MARAGGRRASGRGQDPVPGEGTRGRRWQLFDRPRAPDRMRLVAVADAHVTPEATGTWKVYHRTAERLRAAVADAVRRGVDAGDLTRDGTPAEFDRVDGLLDPLRAPLLAVPGNHDVPEEFDGHGHRPSAPSPTGRPAGRSRSSGVGGLDIVGLDSATAPDPDRSVVDLHHNLTHAPTHTGAIPDGDFYQVDGAAALREVLAAGGVDLVVSGHVHWPAVAPATRSFPQSYLLVEVNHGGTAVRFVVLAGPVSRRHTSGPAATT